MKKMNKKGFTLAELLIVVAIIAVLVAVAIPVFTTPLEKSRQATDLANLRSSYAEAVASYLGGTDPASGSYYKMQSKNGDFKEVDITALDSDLQTAISGGTTQGDEYCITVKTNASDATKMDIELTKKTS